MTLPWEKCPPPPKQLPRHTIPSSPGPSRRLLLTAEYDKAPVVDFVILSHVVAGGRASNARNTGYGRGIGGAGKREVHQRRLRVWRLTNPAVELVPSLGFAERGNTVDQSTDRLRWVGVAGGWLVFFSLFVVKIHCDAVV